jgi:uncharacterized membrane protein
MSSAAHTTTLASRGSQLVSKPDRLVAIDMFRGIAMILMALDHVRDYFTHLRFPPEFLAQTYLSLFLTRWVTHYCAPGFIFLAGTGAYLSLARGKTPSQLSRFLLTRGLWLVFLELTVIHFAWTFTTNFLFGIVIWVLGLSMIIMAGLVRLPMWAITTFGFVTVFGHNLLDGIKAESLGSFSWLWHVLHQPGIILHDGQPIFVIVYTIIPWVGVMALGYSFGALMRQDAAKRRRQAFMIGAAALTLFVVLRATNLYGNPSPDAPGFAALGVGGFAVQSTAEKTLISFLNVAKYPPSLQFLLMTLGPALMLISLFDRVNLDRAPWRWAVVFGRVPMFYYILHLFLIHLMAVAVAMAFDQPYKWLLTGGFLMNPIPPGYGHNLPFIYLMWLTTVVLLYFPCRWFAEVKRRRRDWWLGYL